jgi:HEAT repeat protein
MTRELSALVDHYLLDWDSRAWAGSYHSLIELGAQILPDLTRRLDEARDVAFRAALVELARQLRSADALPLFEAALQDPSPEVWKQALDGLVALASPASILLLEDASRREPPGKTSATDWASWVGEALQQARAEYGARGGAA